MAITCLSLVTTFVIFIEINGLRRLNDFGSFWSDIKSNGRPILRGGSDSMDFKTDGRPILREGSNELADTPEIDVDIDVLVKPNRQATENNATPDGKSLLRKRPIKSMEAENNATPDGKSLLRKRPIKSMEDVEESQLEDKLPARMRTVMPESSQEINSQSSEEQIISLIEEDNKSGSEQKSEEDGNFEQQQRLRPKTTPEWTKDLKTYVSMLSSKYERSGMIDHIIPVVKVLERTHQIKIKDIDVDKRGKVKVVYKNEKKDK